MSEVHVWKLNGLSVALTLIYHVDWSGLHDFVVL